MELNFLYHYSAKVIDVYDGDTIRAEINLGFGLKWKGSDNRGVPIRLYGINAPEMKGTDNELGTKSRDWLRSKILGKEVVIKTIKDSSEKYGRYLGIIYVDSLNINEEIVKEGLAVNKDY